MDIVSEDKIKQYIEDNHISRDTSHDKILGPILINEKLQRKTISTILSFGIYKKSLIG